MDRIILHSDLNNFYASVECLLHPELRTKRIAVCGSKEDRHGIVLAKNQLAKKCGVTTGETIWQAQKKCPDLVIVSPTFNMYSFYSKVVKNIYLRYTDKVESFGPDECWLDVTGSTKLFGSGEEIAEKIRTAVKAETGLTVSIGVSFNKVFAKIGSDIRKPDAVTVISRGNYKEVLYNLPADCMLGVGHSTAKNLAEQSIRTIGDLAAAPKVFLKERFGKCGEQMWLYANGLDDAEVADADFSYPIKSIGNGTTCTADLCNTTQVRNVIMYLATKVSHRLRIHKLKAGGISLSIKNSSLKVREYRTQLPYATVSIQALTACAAELFKINYDWSENVRAVTVRAINLQNGSTPMQMSMFLDAERIEKEKRAEDAMEDIKNRFGSEFITYAALMGDMKIASDSEAKCTLPGHN